MKCEIYFDIFLLWRSQESTFVLNLVFLSDDFQNGTRENLELKVSFSLIWIKKSEERWQRQFPFFLDWIKPVQLHRKIKGLLESNTSCQIDPSYFQSGRFANFPEFFSDATDAKMVQKNLFQWTWGYHIQTFSSISAFL